MLSNKFIKLAVASLTVLSISTSVQAHRVWIKPNKTVLSGETSYVTFDAAVSNTIFVADHAAYRANGVIATGPEGDSVELENMSLGKYRSTFDVKLTKSGTYRIGAASAGIRAAWRDEEGNRKRWPARGKSAEDQSFETAVPKNAKDLEVSYSSRRVETFVTLGELSSQTLKPSNKGLELVPLTHPNDLFATETANFKFLIDGEPAKDVEIEVVRGGMRYRNDSETITLKTNAKGEFNVTWPEAGMYFLEASYKDDKAQLPATTRQGAYAATLEVLPL